MKVGDTRRLSVMDNLGRTPTGVQWSVDNATIATLSMVEGAVTLTGVSAGSVVVTAAWQGLTATTEADVMAVFGEADVLTREFTRKHRRC